MYVLIRVVYLCLSIQLKCSDRLSSKGIFISYIRNYTLILLGFPLSSSLSQDPWSTAYGVLCQAYIGLILWLAFLAGCPLGGPPYGAYCSAEPGRSNHQILVHRWPGLSTPLANRATGPQHSPCRQVPRAGPVRDKLPLTKSGPLRTKWAVLHCIISLVFIFPLFC